MCIEVRLAGLGRTVLRRGREQGAVMENRNDG